MTFTSRPLLASVVLTAVLAAALTGCGDDDSSSSGHSDTAKIMVMLDLSGTSGAFEPYKRAAEASVKAVNARTDGVDIALTVCDTQSNANGAAACGRKAAKEGFVGVLSVTSNDTYFPFLESAKIADINSLTTPKSYTSPMSFSVDAAAPGAIGGGAAAAKLEGCAKVTLVQNTGLTAAGNDQVAAAFHDSLDDLGIGTGTPQFPSIGTADMTPFVTSAIRDDSDCVVLSSYGADTVNMIKTVEDLAPTMKIIAGQYTLSNDAVTSLDPQVLDKLVVVSETAQALDTDNPAVKQWVKDLADADPDYSNTEARMWMGINLYSKVINDLDKVDAESVSSAMAKLHDYDPGLAPPLSYDETPGKNPYGDRVFAQGGILIKWDPAQQGWKSDGDFFNVFTGEPMAS